MFATLIAYNGQKTEVQVRHVMAVWQSEAQSDMTPPQVSIMLQCGSSGEEFLFQGDLEATLQSLRWHDENGVKI
jgi:hypothetical protein